MQFAPTYVDRQPLTAEEEAYNFLLDAICSGRYRKGDRLIAEDIASEIDMSRMPVREAFRRLDAQGLVTLRPNRGAIVSGLDIDELHEVFEMRSALEGLAVRVAVGRIGERQLAALERMLDEMDDYRDESAAWVSRHRAFHEYLCSLSGRPRLMKQISALYSLVEAPMRLWLQHGDKPLSARQEHAVILDAIRAGDAARAEAVPARVLTLSPAPLTNELECLVMHKRRALLVALSLGLCTQWATAAPQVPERLQKVDKLTYCSGMDSPPLVSFDESQKPRGLTVDLGLEIAKRLGDKQVQWRVIPFSGLVPALLAQQCDMIVDQLFDKPERRQVIDIVNYMYSSQSVVVPKGNPKGIKALDDLSGHKVAVLNGSTIKTLLDTQNESLAKAGKPPMKLVVYNTDTDAFQALRISQVDAYGTTVETAGYYAAMAPDLFQEGVPAFSRILTGLGMRKDDPQLTAAVQQVISDMRSDGSYVALLNKWHVSSDTLD
ncbi:hypothetical protein BHE74_00000020 [Ensete ventricosum]|nr:hypothetical protein BHE74_00000020 [Ensete ventricosum]